jgi:D-aminopeptidase
MTVHQFTGGTGTSSRILDTDDGSGKQYMLAAICQSNYGLREHLVIGGVPIGRILKQEQTSGEPASKKKDGSIIIIIITDAPLTTTQLNRVARHATAGLTMVGSYSVGRNSSGDIFLALSTAPHGPEYLEGTGPSVASRPAGNTIQAYEVEAVKNISMNPFFVAAAEAVEEAILNSAVAASDGVVGMDGTKVEGLPVDRVRELLKQHLVKV